MGAELGTSRSYSGARGGRGAGFRAAVLAREVQRQPRPLGSAARDGRAASAAVSPAAWGQVCGQEEVRAPPAVSGRLEVRLEAYGCLRACEDPGGLGARPRGRGVGRGRGGGVGLGFEGSGLARRSAPAV